MSADVVELPYYKAQTWRNSVDDTAYKHQAESVPNGTAKPPAYAHRIPAEGWSTCATSMQEFDENMIRDYKEEIDTILVFAGLLSGVVTAFIIEFYKLLQEDPNETTARLLAQMVTQLNSFQTSPGFVNSTNPSVPVMASTFTASAGAKRINILFFLSLVLALVAALIAILVKQWLREHLTWVTVAPPLDGVMLRQYRYDALGKWQVFRIIGLLPLLVQASVVLFLVGMVDMLWDLDDTVAKVITVVVAISVVSALGSVVIPSFSNSCPYKSPLAWSVSRTVTWLSKLPSETASVLMRVWPSWVAPAHRLVQQHRHSIAAWTAPSSWQEQDLRFVRKIKDPRFRCRPLAWAFKWFLDADCLDSVAQCLRDLEERDGVVPCMFELVTRDMPYSPDELRSRLRGQHPVHCVEDEVIMWGSPRVVTRQLHMSLAVLQAIRDGDSSESMHDVLLLVTTLWKQVPVPCEDFIRGFIEVSIPILSDPEVCTGTDMSKSIVQMIINRLSSLCHPAPPADHESVDNFKTTPERRQTNHFRTKEIVALIRWALQVHDRPPEAPEATLPPSQDGLFIQASSLALFALGGSRTAPHNADVLSLIPLLSEKMVPFLNVRKLVHRKTLIRHWMDVFHTLAVRNRDLLSPSTVEGLLHHMRHRGGSQTSLDALQNIYKPAGYMYDPGPVPAGWEERKTASEPPLMYYYENATGKSTWTDPRVPSWPIATFMTPSSTRGPSEST